MRYLLIVTYKGKNYNGYQIQPNGTTIQQTLENAIKTITKQEVNCVASGRTDAGVSAYCQPVHFETKKELDEQKIIGKDCTPFLLKRIVELTSGESLEANIALVLNNARLGAKIALEYGQLKILDLLNKK